MFVSASTLVDEALALVVALAVGDGEPVFVGEPVDEGVADSDGVLLAESDALVVVDAESDGFALAHLPPEKDVPGPQPPVPARKSAATSPAVSARP